MGIGKVGVRLQRGEYGKTKSGRSTGGRRLVKVGSSVRASSASATSAAAATASGSATGCLVALIVVTASARGTSVVLVARLRLRRPAAGGKALDNCFH